MKISVINGPNINMLGVREPDLYGKADYAALVGSIERAAADLGVEVTFFQSNSEGDIVTEIQRAYGTADAIVLNAAAYTHTSVAILDARRGAPHRHQLPRGVPPPLLRLTLRRKDDLRQRFRRLLRSPRLPHPKIR